MSDNDTTARMAEISHTNPYTGETAGRLFNRGPAVAADGGQDVTDTDGTAPESTETMADVEHTPPHEADDANRVFERGRTQPVEDDE